MTSGGMACELLMNEEGLEFRATKDIDLVLIVEAMSVQFGKRFWEYISQAGYEHQNKSTGFPQFYRFSHPQSSEYPYMIELFTRGLETFVLPENATLTPLPIDDDISSLSAILLNKEYYEFLLQGRVKINGITILDAGYLIPFKAKAWIDLTDKKAAGESIDSKSIRKHKNDIFRLSVLLKPDIRINVTSEIYKDMQTFCEAMKQENVDTRQLGLLRDKEDILEILTNTYQISQSQHKLPKEQQSDE